MRYADAVHIRRNRKNPKLGESVPNQAVFGHIPRGVGCDLGGRPSVRFCYVLLSGSFRVALGCDLDAQSKDVEGVVLPLPIGVAEKVGLLMKPPDVLRAVLDGTWKSRLRR